MNLQKSVVAFFVSLSLGLLVGCGQESGSQSSQGMEPVKLVSESVANASQPAVKKERKAKPFTGEPVDINKATAKELVAVLKGTGVGEEKVKKIIEYRDKNNGVKKIEELLEVNGIGQKTLDKMRERVFISEKSSDSSK